VRGVIEPLLAEQPAELIMRIEPHTRRSNSRRSSKISADLGGGFHALTTDPFDLIINGTAADWSAKYRRYPQPRSAQRLGPTT